MLTPVPTRRLRRTAAEGLHLHLPVTPAAGPDAMDEMPGLAGASSSRDVAEGLRRSTLRAYHALRDAHTTPETLRALRDEVADLEGEVVRLGLRRLRPFVSALRRRVEDAL